MTDMETKNKRPSTLTEEERTETEKLIEAYNLIPADSVGRLIAVAYIEGVAAGSSAQPKGTA